MAMKFSRDAACVSAALVAVLAVAGPPGLAQVVHATQRETPETLTLAQAIARAMANEPAFAAAVAEQKVAALDRKIARTALLFFYY